MFSIEAEDVWIKFNVEFFHNRVTLRGFLSRLLHKQVTPAGHESKKNREDRNEFWALRGVNLSVEPGQTVGLLGANGAGKSTFLMTMAGIYQPNRGSVKLRGTVGTLLSLGAGFTPDLTGVENIRQSGIFMGLSSEYIDENLPKIIELADIGEFIYAPLKTYSSGMKARLGFAMAVHIDPDIVLLDEVLATGDRVFRQKSANLLRTFKEKGKTVVIASHGMKELADSCDRVLWLDRGSVVADGPAEEVIEEYKKWSQKKES